MSLEAASSQVCGCMLNAMKYRHLALPLRLPLRALLRCLRPFAQAQMPRPMSSQAVNDRAVVMASAAEFSLQQGDVASAAATYYEVAKRTQDAEGGRTGGGSAGAHPPGG